jgi:hypothetical protein
LRIGGHSVEDSFLCIAPDSLDTRQG